MTRQALAMSYLGDMSTYHGNAKLFQGGLPSSSLRIPDCRFPGLGFPGTFKPHPTSVEFPTQDLCTQAWLFPVVIVMSHSKQLGCLHLAEQLLQVCEPCLARSG